MVSITYLSTVVSRIYPSANPSLCRFIKRSIYAAGCGDHGGGRGGHFNGRGCGRGRGERCGRGRGVNIQGGHGGDSGAHENRIDISDDTCYFENSEWAKLSNDTGTSITEDPARTNFMANKKKRTTSSVSVERGNGIRLISQIITGVQNASRNESGLAGGVTRFPTNGSRAQVSATNRVGTSSNRNET